jgi:phosphoglycolate phosphatase-like HAD superfamily hydrolase
MVAGNGSAPPSRGAVIFDLDGTLVDDMLSIGRTAAKTIHEQFGTPVDKALIEYYSTTGKPFEYQLRELYPARPHEELHQIAMMFREEKVKDAYLNAKLFPEMRGVLKELDRSHWILLVSTGAEREIARGILEREGVEPLFDGIMGSGEGTKDVHLNEYMRRRPNLPHALVGDAEFDMEVASAVKGVTAIGRATNIPGWAVTPSQLKRWGAVWADYTLKELPRVLDGLVPIPG